ncbi:VWA domain-containing protein [Mycobacterium sp. OTB74]|uniref:VWA domain-containing protein n=1 Tax=Mycobacterium sp. OTB74 TaxID=1853452 RepID=UPI002475B448|nr:VWA domain-containing protein [Mycobacterium sp. OTB74]MDH6243082.1 Ca-activated chloride channel family protein [Mycobacterium sp. OTB74]
MDIPFVGPLTLSGFTSAWFFVFLVAVVAAVVAYLLLRRARRKRVLRFANTELLEQVVAARPKQQSRWRNLPIILLITSLVLLTTAMAGPTHDIRIPRNRAVVMLVIDVSESMIATDVAPSRIEAAKSAGQVFVRGLTPGISVGLVEFSGSATMLVAPTSDHDVVVKTIETLQPSPRTATGEGIFTALQAIATLGAVMGGGDGPPPARMVLMSDGKETVPADPNDPRGALTAARAAKDQGVEISTIAFGTPDGIINYDGQEVPVPPDPDILQKISKITGGQAFRAESLDELSGVYANLQQQIGYQTIRGDASGSWTRIGFLVLVCALFAGVRINNRLPG